MNSGITLEDFGFQLRKYRKRIGLSQTALSGLSTVSVRAVRNLEQGQVLIPRRDTVRLLADALRLTAQERVAFEKAAGSEAGDALFDTLTMPPTAVARPLHGRHGELQALLRHVVDGHQRITAITGFAGVGKTRLALALAAELQSVRDVPTLWVPLRRDTGGQGAEARSPADGPYGSLSGWAAGLVDGGDGTVNRLARLIGDRLALLVLDGNDAGQVARSTMWHLLAECPNLRILETARSPQGAPEDHYLPLGPLATPPPGANPAGTASAPAMTLLLDLLAELQPGFRADEAELPILAELCRRLDGLPRALEAAAAWLTIVSADRLVVMARDEPQLIADRPGESGDALATIRESVTGQPADSLDLLLHLADYAEPWTVERIVTRIGVPWKQAASAVHAFLQCGLIVKVSPGSGALVQFTVLNLVRAFLQTARPAAAG
ncbi:transcriptional regulator with XRE-family HTH domain [Kitasatospora sp. GP30]|uniref:helix-turn-helix domain-containing protein n=1 Tax=Kitasatospora sp. GP30 TaxID=3035084 RepID=UPI000C7026F1|nr:helix-turn-helix domain-containing protein [Kitasatospora sp. GP30]MDH6145956.1 transcriptional regulator with XRE-family HTH domain [Kitasatospora sp. GP30]